MKALILALSIFMAFNVVAQNQKSLYDTFIRVYDLNGKKIAKGKPTQITHNTLYLVRGNKGTGVNYKNIGTIKTKRSRGHGILVSTLIGVSSGAVVGAIVTEPGKLLSPGSKGEGALAAAIIGAPVGATIGSIGSVFKKEETFIINGELEGWKAFVARFPGTNPDGLLSLKNEY